MRELRTSGSVRGAASNGRPYRERMRSGRVTVSNGWTQPDRRNLCSANKGPIVDVRHSSFGKTEIPLAGQSRFDGSQCTPTFQIDVRYKAAAASKEQTKAAKRRLTSLCPAEVASVRFQ